MAVHDVEKGMHQEIPQEATIEHRRIRAKAVDPVFVAIPIEAFKLGHAHKIFFKDFSFCSRRPDSSVANLCHQQAQGLKYQSQDIALKPRGFIKFPIIFVCRLFTDVLGMKLRVIRPTCMYMVLHDIHLSEHLHARSFMWLACFEIIQDITNFWAPVLLSPVESELCSLQPNPKISQIDTLQTFTVAMADWDHATWL